MPQPCSVAGCKSPARGRGLCLTHYSAKWKVDDLPPKKMRPAFVLLKCYLTKEQVAYVKKLAAAEGKKNSAFLRDMVTKVLAAKKMLEAEGKAAEAWRE